MYVSQFLIQFFSWSRQVEKVAQLDFASQKSSWERNENEKIPSLLQDTYICIQGSEVKVHIVEPKKP